jgi:hypothetical protein
MGVRFLYLPPFLNFECMTMQGRRHIGIATGFQTRVLRVRTASPLPKNKYLTNHHLQVDTEISMLQIAQFTKAIPAGTTPEGTLSRVNRTSRDDP